MCVWTIQRMTSAELSALRESLQQQDTAKQLGEEKIPAVVWPNRHRMGFIFSPIADIGFNADEVLPQEGSQEYKQLRRNRRLAAKRSVEDFLRHQSTAPRTSNPKGRFNVWREEKLVRMFKIIEQGVALVDGAEKAAWELPLPAASRPPMERIFYDIWEAKKLSPQFAQDARDLAYNPNKQLSDRRIYDLIQQRNPALHKGLLANKMKRDEKLVRSHVIFQ